MTTPTDVVRVATGGTNESAAAAAVAAVTAENTRAPDFGLWLNKVNDALVVADFATTAPVVGLGLAVGDTITEVNGQPVKTEREFLQVLLDEKVRDQQIDVALLRDGVRQVVHARPAHLVRGMVAADPFYQIGMVVDSKSDSPIVVQRVFPRTPAFYAGLRAGDVITGVAGQPVTPTAFQSGWRSGDNGLALQINRGGQSRNLLLDTLSEPRSGAGGIGATASNGARPPSGSLETPGTSRPSEASPSRVSDSAARAPSAANATQRTPSTATPGSAPATAAPGGAGTTPGAAPTGASRGGTGAPGSGGTSGGTGGGPGSGGGSAGGASSGSGSGT